MKRWAMVGIGLLLLAVVAQFPAAWLAPAVGQQTSGRWRLAETAGTVWEGRAVLYSYDRATNSWSPGRALQWRVSWSKLLRGRLAAQLGFDDGGKADLSAGSGGWSLNDVSATLPAAQLAVLLPSNVGDYGWAGTVAARASVFGCTWGRPVCAGQVDLLWEGAATTQIPGPPLGDYGVRITGEGDALRFTLTTLRGRLQAAGAGEISGGRLRFTGEMSSAGDDVRLDAVLRTVGRPGPGAGRYLVEYRDSPGAR